MVEGKLCVKDFNFIAVKQIMGSFNANGILGFAPSDDNKSYIKALKDQGQIQQQIVSFNYENPLDTSMRSQVLIGGVNYAEV